MPVSCRCQVKILLKNPTGGASSLFAGTLSRALAQALSDFPVFSTKLGTKLATKEAGGASALLGFSKQGVFQRNQVKRRTR